MLKTIQLMNRHAFAALQGMAERQQERRREDEIRREKEHDEWVDHIWSIR